MNSKNKKQVIMRSLHNCAAVPSASLTLAAVFCFFFFSRFLDFLFTLCSEAVKATLSECYKHLRSSQSTGIVGRRMDRGEGEKNMSYNGAVKALYNG